MTKLVNAFGNTKEILHAYVNKACF